MNWRVATNADGTESRNLHDKHLLLWQTDDTNAPTAKHTHEPADYGNLVSRHDPDAVETTYYHYDALGSTAALTDQSQVIDDTYTYKAYGETQHTGATEQPFQWVGELGYQYDPETDRHHLRRRDYDSHLAKFISEDPLGFHAGDSNLSRYVKNRPTISTDATGLYEQDFHFYVIYYLMRSRGWSGSASSEVSYWSQYIDDASQTQPLQLKFAFDPADLQEFHFWIDPNDPRYEDDELLKASLKGGHPLTIRNPANLERIVKDLGQQFSGSQHDHVSRARLGTYLHTYADTWSHEGFSACWHDVNRRTGGFRPNLGHADSGESGHAPDRPYNDITKAVDAARAIWEAIPLGPEKEFYLSWETVESDLTQAFRVSDQIKYTTDKTGRLFLDPNSDANKVFCGAGGVGFVPAIPVGIIRPPSEKDRIAALRSVTRLRFDVAPTYEVVGQFFQDVSVFREVTNLRFPQSTPTDATDPNLERVPPIAPYLPTEARVSGRTISMPPGAPNRAHVDSCGRQILYH